MRDAGLKTAPIVVAAAALAAPALTAGDEDIPRTASGRPDFTGHYDVATLTPLARPQAFGDELFLTREEADRRVRQAALLRAASEAASDPDREAPPDGGDGSPGAAGNVGGYNSSGSTTAPTCSRSTASSGPRSSPIRRTGGIRR